MDFEIDFPILVHWKDDSYDLFVIIVDWFTKIVHHEPVKVIIDAAGLAESIIDMMI